MQNLESRALFSSIVWDGGGDGVSWGVSLNWNPNRLPNSSDDVEINVSETPAIEVNQNTPHITVKSLLLAETLRISGSSITVTAAFTINSTVIVDGGELSAGTLNVTQGTLTLNDGGQLSADVAEVGAGATVTVNTAAVFGAMHIFSGGQMTHGAGQPGFDVGVTGDLTVDEGGSINVNSMGAGSASGPGAGNSAAVGQGSAGAGGAGYGGAGGNGYSLGGPIYGDLRSPTALGSGGGNMRWNPGGIGASPIEYGGAGGGKISLHVGGRLTVNGTITADGGDGDSGSAYWGSYWYGGGGSGGSIWIKAGTIAGSGKITARGGYGGNGGGGGGGRIAVVFESYEFDSGSFNVNGGTGLANGGLGSLYSNGSPTVTALRASPYPVAPGSQLALAADGVADADGNVRDVRFYLESNGTPGLQTSIDGDTLLSIDLADSNGWDWTGPAPATEGLFTYYAFATDADEMSSGIVSTVATVSTKKPPTILSLAGSPDPIASSEGLLLSANSVIDADDAVAAVRFYREANAVAGLQTNAGGDALVATDDDGADGWLGQISVAGLVSGVYTYYAQAIDDAGFVSNVVSTTSALVNHAPAFFKGSDPIVPEDSGPQVISGWATGITTGLMDDPGQSIDFLVSNDHNSLFLDPPAIDRDGVLTFTPAPDASGSATVTVRLHDNGGTSNGSIDTSALQTFMITVTPVNDAPSFGKGADQAVLEDSGLRQINAWATEISAGPADESSQALNFSVSNDNPSLFSIQPSISVSGVLKFRPALNANGAATVTVVLHDSGGNAGGGVDDGETRTFTLVVEPINDAPSFTKGPDPEIPIVSGNQTLFGWAAGISAGPPDEANRLLVFSVFNNNENLFSIQPALSETGTLTFTPAADANGIAILTVRLVDDGGTGSGGVNISPAQTFKIFLGTAVRAPGKIGGVVFNDANGDGKKNAGENTISRVRVFLDNDNDRILDGDEVSVLTSKAGRYHFDAVAPGRYRLRVVLKRRIIVRPISGTYLVRLLTGQSLGGKNFGLRRTSATSPTN